MSQASILESFFVSNYHDSNLPPLWQVIYQEAIRGHHLLFRKQDVELFASETRTCTTTIDDSWSDALEPVIMDLLHATELRTMVDTIDALELTQRRNLFRLYKHVLWIWTHYVKTQMN
jgi:hypothetical protein